ncbi:disulfide bond formation protein B [Microbulbifer sp. A4B17]|uniref:disulfide bond formation protein B n=1 Tax=Microbulbifer sp. A4B17 TaxID=359370 RepID=UPI0013004E12|nr:disulfide bond formation protein B [Microbulbifer sp. A4B17]
MMVFMVRKLDSLVLLAVTIVLWITFILELILHQHPCPLCHLQRLAFVMTGVGLMMNLRFSTRAEHYGVAILSSLAGLGTATRQILLYIMPGDPGFGSPIFGLHLYTWSALIFFAILAYCGVALMFGFKRRSFITREFSFLEKCIVLSFFTVVLANLVVVLLECGLGPCTRGSFGYHWLWH